MKTVYYLRNFFGWYLVKSKNLFFILLLLQANFSFAQNNRTWGRYYGGPLVDGNGNIATDAMGNVYQGGFTVNQTGIAAGGFQTAYGGGFRDAFLIKYGATGNVLWSTYYGGTNDELGMNVATDIFGNVYLAGYTNSINGISSPGSYQPAYAVGTGYDAFLVKFDSNGNRLWATYFGGPADEWGYDVCTDSSGNVYLTGYTLSFSGIAFGGFQNISSGNHDAFLVKFDGNGNRIWATYFGGAGGEWGYNVATDGSGNVYMTGFTGSTSGIAFGGFQQTYGGGFWDSFLVKFDSIGNRIWATYYGGLGNEDYGEGVTTDPLGNVYLAGQTNSISGIASGGFQNIYGGGLGDSFLAKFDASGNRIWATYYGGLDKEDEFTNIITDKWGNVYLAATSYSANGIASGGYQNSLIGIENNYLVKFDSNGIRLCATYYGIGHQENSDVGVDNMGNVYLSGHTSDASGIATPAFQNTYGGSYDFFLVKFTSCCQVLNIPNLGNDTSFCEGSFLILDADNPGSQFLWSTGQSSQTISVSNTGIYWVDVTSAQGCTIRDSILINVISNPIVIIAPDTSICEGDFLLLNAGNPGSAYVWSTGDSSQTIAVSTQGMYWVDVVNGQGCVTRDSFELTVVAVPIVAIGPDTSFCEGSFLILDADNPGSQFLWSTGQNSQIISVSNTGIYWVDVTSAQGCTIRDSILINVISNPIVIIAPDTSICEGDSLLLNAGNPGYTYVWSTGDSSQTIAVSTQGMYWVDVVNGQGCVTRDSFELTVVAVPIVAIGPDTSFCEGNLLILDADNPGSQFLWSTGQNSQIISVSNTGIYWVDATNGQGCTTRDSISITVLTNPSINLGPDTSICSGDSLTLNAGNIGVSYFWSTGDSSQVISAITSGTYWVQVSDLLCTASDTIVLNFTSIPIVILGPDQIICPDSNLFLDAGNPGASFLWSTGDTAQVITIDTAGTFWVEVNYAGCIASDTVSVSLFTNIQFSIGPDTVICEGDIIILDAGNSFSNYHWWDGSTNQTYLVNMSGTYWVQVTDKNGCSKIDSITILPCVNISGGTELSEIEIYPNPAKDLVNVKISANDIQLAWRMMNSLGQIITHSENEIIHQSFSISLKDIPDGIYWLEVFNKESNAKKTFRVVVLGD